ncbi:hypothetical protein DICSQDRAFT_174801 [Dichomitus squalens LYAD-421 SS1]|uniref:F-box domain-containing protein n=1 Tax=Dichomitus squalens (strain LYAD-421) TaxID=732165 RepID=R7SLG5_DICSQ|nr:uncharacterized protein DICSQDRAFT_174801 [Dichomitus squalens LYAD-421 SS1]EJF56575.1 hypothetical protein DICSQDRAFT_174801 [Dichomitus squalens LYAD-421 SS1]
MALPIIRGIGIVQLHALILEMTGDLKLKLAVLNWDVLLRMVTLLSRPDVSSLMKTSHELYELCLRQLFHDPVEVRTDNILSLHGCLRIGTSHPRSHYLRDITISSSLSCLSRSAGHVAIENLLSDILNDASLLRCLRLDWGAAGLSTCFRLVPTALESLEEVHLPLVSQELWHNFQDLRSPIRKLTARFGPMHRLPAPNPISLLVSFGSTLEELHFAMVQFEDDTVCYPRVHKLHLADCYFGLTRGGIDIAPVVRAFPHVLDFSLSAAQVKPMVSHWEEGRCCDHADVIDRCRVLNGQWQREHEGWMSLQSVTVGHIIDLYMLGFSRPIPHVGIQAFSEGTLWMFRHVLSDTRPSHLTISLFARDQILNCLPRLICAEDSATSLTQFTVVLRCDVAEINVEKIITNLTDLLVGLSVEDLSLRMLRWDTVGPYRLPQDGLRAIDSALDRIYGQTAGIAARILGGIPSLRQLTLTVAQREARWIKA